jgi:hypothetical protein
MKSFLLHQSRLVASYTHALWNTVRGTPLHWLQNNLSNRTQKVKVNSTISGEYFTSSIYHSRSAPGFILGPVIFNLFINDVFQFATYNVEKYLYADDTAIILSADTNRDMQILINNLIVTFYNWCTNNCILINPLKSNYLLFNSLITTVSINGHNFDNPLFVKYMGIYIDNKLCRKQ